MSTSVPIFNPARWLMEWQSLGGMLQLVFRRGALVGVIPTPAAGSQRWIANRQRLDDLNRIVVFSPFGYDGLVDHIVALRALDPDLTGLRLSNDS